MQYIVNHDNTYCCTPVRLLSSPVAIVVVVAHRAVAIIVDFVARRAVAIVSLPSLSSSYPVAPLPVAPLQSSSSSPPVAVVVAVAMSSDGT